MDNQTFTRSLFVKDERHIIREITCIADALVFMGDWPESRRGPVYGAALRACQAVVGRWHGRARGRRCCALPGLPACSNKRRCRSSLGCSCRSATAAASRHSLNRRRLAPTG